MMNSEFPLPQVSSDVTRVGPEKPAVQAPSGAGPAPAKDTFASVQHIPDLDQVLRDSSKILQQHNQHLSFTVDESSGHMVVSVIDSKTSEVIRQFPSEEMLEISHKLRQMIEEYSIAEGGLLVEKLT